MSTMLTVEQFPNEMALIMAQLSEQASHTSDMRKLYNCGKLFCLWAVNDAGLIDLETKSVKRIRELIDDNGVAVFLAKYVELEDKTDG